MPYEIVVHSNLPNVEERTRRNARRMLSARLGGLEVAVTTADSPDLQTLIMADLIDTEKQPDAYSGYAYVASGPYLGEQARLQKRGFSGSLGRFGTTKPFSGIITAGTTVELHSVLPPDRADRMAGLHAAINEALSSMWFEDDIPFEGSSGALSYTLDDYPWLRRSDYLQDIVASTGIAGTNPTSWPGGAELRLDGPVPTLDIRYPFGAGEVFWARVHRPAHTLIKAEGYWVDAVEGLQADDDESLMDTKALVELAYWYAIRQVISVGAPQADTADWEKLYARQAIIAKSIMQSILPSPRERVARPGGIGSGWGSMAVR